MRATAFLLAIVAASVLVCLSASPVSNAGTLRSVVRVANFGDVAHTFESRYKFGTTCPDKIVFKDVSVDSQRNIGSVPLGDITEDGVTCKGTDGATKMSLVSEATVKQGNLLERLGFPKAFTGLQNNRAAKATVDNSKSDSSLLVGFDEGGRECGASTYSSNSFYFFIRESVPFKITIRTGENMELTNVTLPPNSRVLFITGDGNKLCLLVDPTSVTPTSNIAVASQDEEGVAIPSVTPSMSSTPIPSKSPAMSPTPSASSTGGPASVLPVVPAAVATASASASPSIGSSPSVSVTPAPSLSGSGAATGSEPSSSPSSNGGSVCFPGSANVELESGAIVPISTLQLGDRVRTSASSFSDVFMFTHRDANVHARFVRLVTRSGAQLTLTASHYLLANGQLTAAKAVQIGDILLLGSGVTSDVTAIESVSSIGLYNPHTLDGKLVVDGIETSTYTTAVHPRVAHAALLAPLRAIYGALPARGVLNMLADWIGANADSLACIMPAGMANIA